MKGLSFMEVASKAAHVLLVMDLLPMYGKSYYPSITITSLDSNKTQIYNSWKEKLGSITIPQVECVKCFIYSDPQELVKPSTICNSIAKATTFSSTDDSDDLRCLVDQPTNVDSLIPVLKRIWGYDCFKHEQYDALKAILEDSPHQCNLVYGVKQKSSKSVDYIADMIKPLECSIVYCSTIKECENICPKLETLGVKCKVSLEAYMQETGRGGRDGLLAQCLLFFTPQNQIFHLKNISSMRKYDSINLLPVAATSTTPKKKNFTLNYFAKLITGKKVKHEHDKYPEYGVIPGSTEY
ncbi:Hypothetical predicted protein, partial [Paramuricea clavata]